MGVQEPRIWLSPEAKSSAGQEAIDLAAACGLILDPWQELCLHEALKESEELVQLESGAWVKKWAASSFGLVVSRQNGKGSILEALELAGLILFGERLIIHSAHEFKALAIDTPILSERGWTTMGDLVDGDRVYGPDGQLTNVIAHPIRYERPCYRLTFDDGQTIVADEDHLWTVYDAVKREHRTLTVRELVDGGVFTTRRNAGRADSNIYRYRVPVTEPLAGVEADLPVDPYLLGYWLGDGDTNAGRFTVGEEDLEAFKLTLESLGYEYSDSVDPRTGAHTICAYGFIQGLREAGVVGNKHIPETYLTASMEQRRALLAGIMDSDGGVTGHQISVTMKNEALMRQVLMLARSLGYKSFFTSHLSMLNGEHKARVYRVKFANRQELNPFRLPRKAAKVLPPLGRVTRAQYNAIVSIEPVESVPTRCITVDNDSRLYVVGHGFVPTHNTAVNGMERLESLIAKSGLKYKAKQAHGAESIEILDGPNPGARVMFQTRTDRSGLGLTADRVIFDEAMTITPGSLKALLPTVSSRPNPQIVYTGTAADQRTQPYCHTFGGVRYRALEQIRTGERKRLCFLEWSAPDDLPEEKFGDPQYWAMANPGLGYRQSEEKILDEYEEMWANLRDFGVDRLGIGDWPQFGAEMSEIPLDKWRRLNNPSPDLAGARALILYRTPEGGPWAIVGSQRCTDGRIHVEVGYAGTDPVDRVVDKFIQAITAWGPEEILVGRGGAAEVIPQIEAAGFTVYSPNQSEEAQACGGFLNDALVDPENPLLSHGDQHSLNAAITRAVKRDLPSGGFVWDCIEPSTYAQLMGVTLGRWALLKHAINAKPTPAIHDWPDQQEIDSWIQELYEEA
ncbi:terminase [Mycobacterium phage LittleE]|uniref:Terminase n=1 Tax=Mycobacterium phage LittleE TaxID=2922212 RepID=G1D3P4_9CAUD|nr:exonuclease [Mycobacterium phage LittleE]AEK09394.1 terminase [Mycobacterium phage LittleE]